MKFDHKNENHRSLLLGFMYGQEHNNIEAWQAIENFCHRHSVEMEPEAKRLMLDLYADIRESDLWPDFEEQLEQKYAAEEAMDNEEVTYLEKWGFKKVYPEEESEDFYMELRMHHSLLKEVHIAIDFDVQAEGEHLITVYAQNVDETPGSNWVPVVKESYSRIILEKLFGVIGGSIL